MQRVIKQLLMAGSLTIIFVILAIIAEWHFMIEQTRLPFVVLRIDDIQDFAYHDVQLFFLNQSIENDIPLSLSVIAGLFGNDTELVNAVILEIIKGSEVTVHGFEHENMTKFSLEEQKQLLQLAKEKLKEILNVNASIFAPPMYCYNNDTLKAMKLTGFDVISCSVDQIRPSRTTEGVKIIPATVTISEYDNSTWNLKTSEDILREVDTSIAVYGYAIILTHPQEFMRDGAINQEAITLYNSLTSYLRERYSLTTIEKLSKSAHLDL